MSWWGAPSGRGPVCRWAPASGPAGTAVAVLAVQRSFTHPGPDVVDFPLCPLSLHACLQRFSSSVTPIRSLSVFTDFVLLYPQPPNEEC